jgi:hypothetical protein
MKTGKHSSAPQGKRFDRATYEAAGRKDIDATQLLMALESSRTVACGVISVLSMLRDHGVPEFNGDTAGAFIDSVQADELLSFCIESMGLLNARIEAVADLLAERSESD